MRDLLSDINNYSLCLTSKLAICVRYNIEFYVGDQYIRDVSKVFAITSGNECDLIFCWRRWSKSQKKWSKNTVKDQW